MAFRSKPQRTTEELHQELIEVLGWAATARALAKEAEAMRLPTDNPAVIRSAWATHNIHRADRRTNATQEGLIP